MSEGDVCLSFRLSSHIGPEIFYIFSRFLSQTNGHFSMRYIYPGIISFKNHAGAPLLLALKARIVPRAVMLPIRPPSILGFQPNPFSPLQYPLNTTDG